MSTKEIWVLFMSLSFVTLWFFWSKGCQEHIDDLQYKIEIEKIHVYGKPTPTPSK